MIDPKNPETIFNYSNMLNEANRKRLREELDAEVQALKTLELIKEAENIANNR